MFWNFSFKICIFIVISLNFRIPRKLTHVNCKLFQSMVKTCNIKLQKLKVIKLTIFPWYALIFSKTSKYWKLQWNLCKKLIFISVSLSISSSTFLCLFTCRSDNILNMQYIFFWFWDLTAEDMLHICISFKGS